MEGGPARRRRWQCHRVAAPGVEFARARGLGVDSEGVAGGNGDARLGRQRRAVAEDEVHRAGDGDAGGDLNVGVRRDVIPAAVGPGRGAGCDRRGVCCLLGELRRLRGDVPGALQVGHIKRPARHGEGREKKREKDKLRKGQSCPVLSCPVKIIHKNSLLSNAKAPVFISLYFPPKRAEGQGGGRRRMRRGEGLREASHASLRHSRPAQRRSPFGSA